MNTPNVSETCGSAPARGPYERLRQSCDRVCGSLAPDVAAALNLGMMRLYHLLHVEGVADDDPSVTAIVDELDELLAKS